MTGELTYISALPEDSDLLTQTALRSKQSWGYSDDLMQLWAEDLAVSKIFIAENNVFKVFDGEQFIGFYGLKIAGETQIELEHLWLLPDKKQQGYGRQLFKHIREQVVQAGQNSFRLTADPNAKPFYDKMGGVIVGKFQSKINGRFLDIYEFNAL